VVDRWQKCKPKDYDAIAELTSYAFLSFTKIHPFFNANGRTFTCVLNIILVSLGHPDILLREHEERDDPDSSYSQAIEKIRTEPELLTQHILNRMQQTRKNNKKKKHWKEINTDRKFRQPINRKDHLDKIIQMRVELSQVIKEVLKTDGKFPANKFFERLVNRVNTLTPDVQLKKDPQRCIQEAGFMYLFNFRAQLANVKNMQKKSLQTSSSSNTVFSEKDKVIKKAKYNQVTQSLELLINNKGEKLKVGKQPSNNRVFCIGSQSKLNPFFKDIKDEFTDVTLSNIVDPIH